MAKKQKILIIEDDRNTLEAMSLTLKSKDYDMVEANDPEVGFVSPGMRNPK